MGKEYLDATGLTQAAGKIKSKTIPRVTSTDDTFTNLFAAFPNHNQTYAVTIQSGGYECIGSTDGNQVFLITETGATRKLSSTTDTGWIGLDSYALKASDFQTALTSQNKGITQKDITDLAGGLNPVGFVGTTAPGSTYVINDGDVWLNAADANTTFPWTVSTYANGWGTATDSFTPKFGDIVDRMSDGHPLLFTGSSWLDLAGSASSIHLYQHVIYFTVSDLTGATGTNAVTGRTKVIMYNTDSTAYATAADFINALYTKNGASIPCHFAQQISKAILSWALNVVGIQTSDGLELSATTHEGDNLTIVSTDQTTTNRITTYSSDAVTQVL
jgi:hypothetical protein